jgi:hypothetical protein
MAHMTHMTHHSKHMRSYTARPYTCTRTQYNHNSSSENCTVGKYYH